MDVGERIDAIKEIVAAIEDWDPRDRDLVLRQFDATLDDDIRQHSDRREFITNAVESLYDTTLGNLLAYVRAHPDVNQRAEIAEPEAMTNDPWDGNLYLRLFVSHVAAHKVEVAALKEALAEYGVSGFVAHEDIEENAEWILVIETALQSCDAALAYLTDDFNLSPWIDQEIGYVISRRRPVVAMDVGRDPYGFIARYQSYRPHPEDSAQAKAKRIVEMLLRHDLTSARMARALISRLVNSTGYSMTIELMRTINAEVKVFSAEMVSDLEFALEMNDQVYNSWAGYQVQQLIDAHKH